MNKMQRLCIAFIDVNYVKFSYSAGIQERIYIRYPKTFMWPSVNRNVFTNQIDIRSEKMHEVTRSKQALNFSLFLNKSLHQQLSEQILRENSWLKTLSGKI